MNTRCIHYRLDPLQSSPKNLTLCPILDFANHKPSDPDLVPILRSTKDSYVIGGDYVFKSSSTHALHAGQEINLRYGGHANRTLFAEYGFVNLWVEGDVGKVAVDGEVDVQNLVEGILRRGDASAAAWTKQVLEDYGYWGYIILLECIYRPRANIFVSFLSDWTLHSSPTPAHPSYRLITALRLFHCFDDGAQKTVPLGEEAAELLIEEWRKVIHGEAEIISEANESRWRSNIQDMCELIVRRAEEGVEAVAQLEEPQDSPVWVKWMQGNIRLLWREELEVARSVLHSIQSGEEF